MNSPTQPTPQQSEPRPSSVGAKLLDRKIRNYLKWGVLGFVIFPFAMIGLFFTDSFGFQMLGMIGALLFGLLIMAGSVIVPIGLIILLVWSVRNYYRKPPPVAQAVTEEAVAAMAAEATPNQQHAQAIDVTMLEELRGRLAKESRRRVVLYVPIALLIAFGIFYGTLSSKGKSSGSPLFAFAILHGMFGIVAWGIAISGPRAKYGKAFKTELLPRLLREYGDLRYTVGTVPPILRLSEIGLLPEYDAAEADDAVEGRYKNYPIRISELYLSKRINNRTHDMFKGLLIDISVDTRMLGLTVVKDNDSDAARRERALNLQHIRLEDSTFNNLYRVSSNDQVEARAILNPAVMEKLMVMSDGKLFFPPRLALEDHRLSFALAQLGSVIGLFEPPALETHTAVQQLAAIRAELKEIFGLVDAMIGMRIAWRPHDAPLPGSNLAPPQSA